MKKFLKILSLIIIMSFILTACGKNGNNKSTANAGKNNSQILNEIEKEDVPLIITESMNKENDIEKYFSNIEEINGLDENTKLSRKEIEENFDFGKYKDLEMEIRSIESEETISEIAIIKLEDAAQTEEIFSILAKRRESLQEKYAENEKVLEIIDNPNNIMQQEGGVVTFIISEKAKEIEEKINIQPEENV